MITKPTLIGSTYQRGGKWYTLRVIDRSSQIETDATEDEIAKATAETTRKVEKAKK